MEYHAYDEVNVTSVNTNEICSRIQTKINPSYGLQSAAYNDQSTAKRTKRKTNANDSQKNIMVLIMLIIMIVILLLFFVASIALSMVTVNQLVSVETQLIIAQSNISQNLNQLDAKLENYISLQTQYTSVQTQTQCGQGLWHRLIFLNMSDPTEQCPFAWWEYNTGGVRACGRPTSLSGSCAAIRHFTSRQYSRVCGRVIGYQFASPDAFRHHVNSNSIDLDGINITCGEKHGHIWSYIAGHPQTTAFYPSKCPCSNDNGQRIDPPSSVGDNYYCESGNPNISHTETLYTNDPLWDGQQCVGEGTCCTGTNSPPWFSVQLPAPATDAIEVSICCDQSTSDEDVPVELIEIYVQ